VVSVSVVIPVFNRAHSIGRAIESALQQQGSIRSVNVVVVNDGSSDDLKGALAPYGDRVRLLEHQTNLGAAAARNTGVAAARDELIAFLDSDDVWLPGKLDTQVAVMQRRGWRASCTACWLHRDGRAPVISPRYREGPLTLDHLVWGCFVSPGSTLVFDRALADEVGPLYADLSRLEDWDWLLRYCRRYPLGFVADPFARVAASSFTDTEKLLAAIVLIRERHLKHLPQPLRRHFAAALDMEKAAALYRAGGRLSVVVPLLSSLMRVPVGHQGAAAILRNRLG